MTDAAGLIDAWLEQTSLSTAEIARRAGVSRSTIHRIRNGQVEPSINTLREIAIAAGADLELRAITLSDPRAASAARSLLESGYPDLEPEWQARLLRITEAPTEIVEIAAVMSDPLSRPDARYFIGAATVGMIASAATSSGSNEKWAISGTPLLDRPSNQQSLLGQAILWSTEPKKTSIALSGMLRETSHRAIASVTVLWATVDLFFDSYSEGIAHYVSPLQAMLDCISLGGATAEAAKAEISQW